MTAMKMRVPWQLAPAALVLSLACVLPVALVLAMASDSVHARGRSGTAPATAPCDACVGLRLVRNATLKVDYGGTVFLVDPMLAEAGAYPGIPGTRDAHRRYPLVDLPMSLAAAIDVDAVVLTHLHADHWDTVAREHLPKSMPIFVQDAHDAAVVRADGFTDVRVLGDDTVFRGTRLVRTGGQHGTDAHMRALGHALGAVSGVVFQRPGHRSIYVAGDTTWHPEVEAAIAAHRPDVIVLNAGDAQVGGFEGSIIMGRDDLVRARRAAPDAVLVAVHLEAVTHATQTRADLKRHLRAQGLDPARALIPEDGDAYWF